MDAHAIYNKMAALATSAGGYSMIMILPNGNYLIRFLVPQAQMGKGTRGLYAEGVDSTFEGALVAATTMLPTLPALK